MRPLLVLAFMTLLPLGAQEIVNFTSRSSGPQGLEAFRRGLSLLDMGTLVVVDDEKGTWDAAFKQLLQDEPLSDYMVNRRVLSSTKTTKLLEELSAQCRWSPGPRWAYLGKDLTVLVEGTTVPSAAALEQALKKAGLKNPVAVLEAFCAQHPDHVEAGFDLLQELFGRATRRMQPLLKPSEESAPSPLLRMLSRGAPEPSRVLVRPLTEAEDARIWGACATRLERLYQGADWTLVGLGVQFVPTLAEHSPRMKAACRKALSQVEAALQRHPGQSSLWSAWVSMSRVVGGRSMRNLLGSLKPLPGAEDLPPESAVDTYVAECRTLQAWGDIRDVLLPRWKGRTSGFTSVLVRLLGPANQGDPLKGIWDRNASPLVEACLRLQDPGTAEEVVKEAIQRYRSRNIPTWASQIALKCNQPQLAQTWAALPVPVSPER